MTSDLMIYGASSADDVVVVARGISDFGMMAIAAAFFIVLSAALMWRHKAREPRHRTLREAGREVTAAAHRLEQLPPAVRRGKHKGCTPMEFRKNRKKNKNTIKMKNCNIWCHWHRRKSHRQRGFRKRTSSHYPYTQRTKGDNHPQKTARS